jgi:tetratricopeptide (TPR) repeat protein
MTLDEAKALFHEAAQRGAAGDAAGALTLLERLDRAVPGSRHVAFERALCLARIGRAAEARALAEALHGQLDFARAARLAEALPGWTYVPVPPRADNGRHPAVAPPPAGQRNAAREADLLMGEGLLEAARARLEEALALNAADGEAHRLLSRLLLYAPEEFRDVKRALGHARRAHELGGANHPEINLLYGIALAENGEPERGVRHLEHAWRLAEGAEARQMAVERVEQFRERYRLGHVWEFADGGGNILLEARSLDEVVRAIRKGGLKREHRCRVNRVGEWRPVEIVFRELLPVAAVVLLAEANRPPARWWPWSRK